MLALLLLCAAPIPAQTAAEIDLLIEFALEEEGVTPSEPSDEVTFLRRLSLDLAGQIPDSVDVAAYAIDPSADREGRAIDRLLTAESYGDRWARYWGAAIFSRATSTRPLKQNRRMFESWLADELNAGTGWDVVMTELLTAEGSTQEVPQTAFFMAHAGEPEEVAGEASRLLMGIQISCAQCHDHPFDRWKREEFHEFAAFFPRVQMRPRRDSGPVYFEVMSHSGATRQRPEPRQVFAFADRDRNGILDAQELQQPRLRQVARYLLRVADTNQDGQLSLEEVETAPPVPINTGQGAPEHLMPDLADPEAAGAAMSPRLMTTGAALPTGTSDLERRFAVSAFLSDRENVWFARSVVNRYWNELLGEGFYVPIDDLGPDREPALPEVVDLLAEGFVESGYDLRWLLETIVRTEAYRRQPSVEHRDLGLAGAAGPIPSRLRGDQIFDTLATSLDFTPAPSRGPRGQTEREYVGELFGPDVSVSQNEQSLGIPQALFLMNADGLETLLSTRGRTRVAAIAREAASERDAVDELFRTFLGRSPSDPERATMVSYLVRSSSRSEAIEDIAWALINSAEFLTKH